MIPFRTGLMTLIAGMLLKVIFVNLRELNHNHIEEIWEINEQGLPGTGKVSKGKISRLLDYSNLAFGAPSSRLIDS